MREKRELQLHLRVKNLRPHLDRASTDLLGYRLIQLVENKHPVENILLRYVLN